MITTAPLSTLQLKQYSHYDVKNHIGFQIKTSLIRNGDAKVWEYVSFKDYIVLHNIKSVFVRMESLIQQLQLLVLQIQLLVLQLQLFVLQFIFIYSIFRLEKEKKDLKRELDDIQSQVSHTMKNKVICPCFSSTLI